MSRQLSNMSLSTQQILTPCLAYVHNPVVMTHIIPGTVAYVSMLLLLHTTVTKLFIEYARMAYRAIDYRIHLTFYFFNVDLPMKLRLDNDKIHLHYLINQTISLNNESIISIAVTKSHSTKEYAKTSNKQFEDLLIMLKTVLHFKK